LIPQRTRGIGPPGGKGERFFSGNDAMNLIDHQAALARLNGDDELLREILGLFLEYTPERRAALRTAIATQDFASVRRTTHALKGSVGYLQAATVTDALQQVDQLAISADAERLTASLANLEQLLDALTAEAISLLNGENIPARSAA